MGYVNVQSRHDPEKILASEILADYNDFDGNLPGLLVGDEFEMVLDIGEELAESWMDKAFPEIRIFEPSFPHPQKTGTRHSAEIKFKVIGRSHYVARDWMGPPMGYRIVLSNITVEATTDEGEELFSQIQDKHEVDVNKWIYGDDPQQEA